MQRPEAAGCGEQVKNGHGAENCLVDEEDVDGCVRRAKLVLLDLESGGLVTPDRENRQQDAHDHKTDAKYQRISGFARLKIFKAKKLAQGHAKFGHYESKDNHADAGAHPGEKGALIRKMFGYAIWRFVHGALDCGSFCHGSYAASQESLPQSLGRKYPRNAGKVQRDQKI